ncbi:hypothetical protein AC578_3397 [Pseudocercospora eumusae]|uniref:AAA+ ATPase domain-containing protein n=1 Tax=Pseudocercospora eumusae TaxID=321146 RepID=A0A139H6E9_9PEZI|nr:hypothetical protein AC578_3397 [Pseudocercospora eumusae]
MASKRKLDTWDPTKSDSDDLDWDGKASSPKQRSRPRSRKANKPSPQKRAAKRQRYDDSDIDPDSHEGSEEEASYSDESVDAPVEINPRTGRGQRSVTKKHIKYEESDEDDAIIAATDQDSEPDPIQPTPARSRTKIKLAATTKPSLIVKLKLPASMDGSGRATRARTSSRSKRQPTPQSAPSTGITRRSSRISHDDQDPLVALTDSGRHEIITRAGSATPEPSARRPTRGGKGLKKPPVSAIFEASQEDIEQNAPVAEVPPTAEGAEFFSKLQASQQEPQVEHTSPAPSGTKGDDITMEYHDDEDEEHVVQESQPDPDEDEDEDEGPISRTGRNLRTRRKASTPPPSQPAEGRTRRSLRNTRRSGAENTSDFEPDAEGEADAEEELSDSDNHLKPGRDRNSSNEASSQGGRRSGRLSRKSASQRSRSRRNASPDDDEPDIDEIADEAAELEEDRRRIHRERPRKQRNKDRSAEINFEPNLRNRGNRPDYRILRPELLLPLEDDDAPALPAATPQRNRRGATQTYRSLFSTFGPFGGGGGPPPVLGGAEAAGATGGVDSDSSDDEMGGRGGQQGVGGTVGMTPTSAFPKPHAATQALNNDPLTGPGGGPPGLGKVKDKKALADADPLGVDTNVTFEGVGGLDNHINQLKEMVALPLLYPEVFQRFHVTPPRGVLFHGPPGTGKTLLARALASSVSSHGRKVTFYMRKGADALSKWVGEAEKQLRLLFEEARKNQPSIIFFDEIDGLAPVRSSKQEQIHASIVATLLALMDGMDGRGQVIVIGATNRPDSVDPALRRPGRFDREFYFPLPDAIGRRKIIDIHTKGWDPPLRPDFKDQLAEVTRGYGGADLRALCTEAALNAVQGTYPQIYQSDKKLIIDPSTIKVLAKDFMISVNKIVPSSERSASSGAAPLKKDIEPLLRRPLHDITARIDKAIPRKRKATALEEAMYDDRDDERGFEKETMQRDFEASRVFRPRLLIKGVEGMGQQYLGAALLSKFEGLHVQNFDLATLIKDSTRSPEAAVVQLFEEVKRHKPSVIYLPGVNYWWETLSDTVKRTFVGLLRSLQPSEPVLVLGVLELQHPDDEVDPQLLRDLFGYSIQNQYTLQRPDQFARSEYFGAILDFIRKPPSEFPEPDQRKKRKLAELEVAPAPAAPEGPSKAELKAQKKKDHQTLNMLKLHIQPVMEQIKLKYRKFRTPIVEEATIAYLFDEQNPKVLTSDLTEEQKAQQLLFRPYEIDSDEKGVPGIREVASQKFYYNLEIVTIEKRLSNGYYKRPKDFLADIKRLAKDAKAFGDQDRLLKANEMLANVEVDMGTLEVTQAVLCAECEAVYQREQERERKRAEKVLEAQKRGEEVPKIVPNVPPPDWSKTTSENSGPVVLGQAMPGANPLALAARPESNPWSTTNGSSHESRHTNGSVVPSRHVPSRQQVDTEMPDNDPANDRHPPPPPLFHQASAQTKIQAGSQLEQYQNSASTTNSGNDGAKKTSDRSSGQSRSTQESNGHPDFFMMRSGYGSGSQLPDTQPQSLESRSAPTTTAPEPPQHASQASSSSSQGSFAPRASSINALLNNPEEENNATNLEDAIQPSHPQLILDEVSLQSLLEELTARSSGLSLEQLEQVRAQVMDVIWCERGNWNRNQVWVKVQEVFNATIDDIDACQGILDPSQRELLRSSHRTTAGTANGSGGRRVSGGVGVVTQ